ncbi:type 2 periplasmic-binding domain-containing protein [Spartinivicinus ruber]|uniref:hypothetical protein n=1 Tax=Spartinivicinus ruber TaxID=2683272 RepID=UPI0013D0067A|nr:hypothetical protein [Spartinivicinus ruber]
MLRLLQQLQWQIKIKKYYLVALLMIFTTTVKSEVVNIVYPNTDNLGQTALGYQVLKLALAHSGVEYQLTLSKKVINPKRARFYIKQGKIDIYDFGTSSIFETELLPIYFPIDRGLNGWRIFIIHKDNKTEFNKVNNLSELQKFVALQGIGWSDIDLLENAGIRVVSSEMHNLFRMLQRKRADFFPLGVNEIYGFYRNNTIETPSLIVDKRVLLIYPFARFFFVNKQNHQLRDIIQLGLERSFANGSFQNLFNAQPEYIEALQLGKLNKRTTIYIDNPDITDEFKAIPKKYFIQLNEMYTIRE